MAFEKNKFGVITCSECGKKYEVIRISLPSKDSDKEKCECGNTLKSWRKECAMYTCNLIK